MRISDWSSDVCSADLPSAFAQATRTADATGLNEIARANGLETSQLVQLLAGETPKDLEPDRLKELDLTKLGADVSSAQQRILVNLLDQLDRASPVMRNSALMLDFLESPQDSRAFQLDRKSTRLNSRQ